MKAAVVYMPGLPPRFEEFPEPTPEQGEVLVQVKAASLSQLSKMRASGSHYTSSPQYPSVCGVDGVALLDNGKRVYCGGCRSPYGMMAERTIVPRALCVPVPDGLDDLTAAALPLVAMSSWIALAYRAQLQPGQTVLILGATGTSGKLAIQIARHLGAGRVVAVGRNEAVLSTLTDLGADAVISLKQSDQTLAETFANEAAHHPFDIVLDYLWSHPAEVLLSSLISHSALAEAHRVRFVSIGEMAGPNASVSSAVLRSSGLEIYGSGGGSMSQQALIEPFPRLWALAGQKKLHIDLEPVPLADVEKAWQRQDTAGRRLVFLP